MKKETGKQKAARFKYALGGETDPGGKEGLPKVAGAGAATTIPRGHKTEVDYNYDLVHDMAYLASTTDPFKTEIGKGFLARHAPFQDTGLLQNIITDLSAFNQTPETANLKGADRVSQYFNQKTGIPALQALKSSKQYDPLVLLNNSPDVGVQQTFAGGGWVQQIPGILDAGISVLENNPNAYSTQPIMSASVMKNMVNPYGKFANGGTVPIEVEDDEVIETPMGQIAQVNGKTHAEGGEDLNVAPGTKIYSDRLSVDGETMQERKLRREKAEAKLRKILEKNPYDTLTRNSLKRVSEGNEMEDAADMEIQQSANRVYAMGGKVKKYPFGGDPYADYMRDMYGSNTVPMMFQGNPTMQNIPLGTGNIQAPTATQGSAAINPALLNQGPEADTPDQMGTDMTTGDWVGLAGNAFNAIAPIINTLKAQKNSLPNVNRFQGYGREALEANTAAQDQVAGVRTNAMTDLNTSANSRFASNRNSAKGINTLRALDVATEMGKNKAANQIDDSFSGKMMQLLAQRSQLENDQDRVVMSGATQVDTENKADRDNFYSNMAQNLVNVGNNVQGIGGALNVAHSNKVDANMLSQLSRYGLTVDENGNIINKK